MQLRITPVKSVVIFGIYPCNPVIYLRLTEILRYGKIALVDFLRNRYENNISSFNIAWRTSFNSFDEILYKNRLGVWPYTTKARSDHFAFNYFVAEQYFRTCHDSIKRYDKNHLILGCRFASWLTPFEIQLRDF